MATQTRPPIHGPAHQRRLRRSHQIHGAHAGRTHRAGDGGAHGPERAHAALLRASRPTDRRSPRRLERAPALLGRRRGPGQHPRLSPGDRDAARADAPLLHTGGSGAKRRARSSALCWNNRKARSRSGWQAMQRHLDYVRRKIDYWKALEAGNDAVARRIADELASPDPITICTKESP